LLSSSGSAVFADSGAFEGAGWTVQACCAAGSVGAGDDTGVPVGVGLVSTDCEAALELLNLSAGQNCGSAGEIACNGNGWNRGERSLPVPILTIGNPSFRSRP